MRVQPDVFSAHPQTVCGPRKSRAGEVGGGGAKPSYAKRRWSYLAPMAFQLFHTSWRSGRPPHSGFKRKERKRTPRSFPANQTAADPSGRLFKPKSNTELDAQHKHPIRNGSMTSYKNHQEKKTMSRCSSPLRPSFPATNCRMNEPDSGPVSSLVLARIRALMISLSPERSRSPG